MFDLITDISSGFGDTIEQLFGGSLGIFADLSSLIGGNDDIAAE